MCFLCKREGGIFTKVSRIPKDLFIPNGKKKSTHRVAALGSAKIPSEGEALVGLSAAEGESVWAYCLHRVLPLVGVLGIAVILKRRVR